MSDDMKVSKGLAFPVVALPGVGHMPAKGEDEQEAAWVFYVVATRATQRLMIGVEGIGGLEKNRFSVKCIPPNASDLLISATLPNCAFEYSHRFL